MGCSGALPSSMVKIIGVSFQFEFLRAPLHQTEKGRDLDFLISDLSVMYCTLKVKVLKMN